MDLINLGRPSNLNHVDCMTQSCCFVTTAKDCQDSFTMMIFALPTKIHNSTVYYITKAWSLWGTLFLYPFICHCCTYFHPVCVSFSLYSTLFCLLKAASAWG